MVTGPALFVVRATEYVENPFLWTKFGAVALGVANLVALHGSASWRRADGTPRASAAGSRSPEACPSPPGSSPSRPGG